ncbi:unnamed protein product [Calypogeia fissa]
MKPISGPRFKARKIHEYNLCLKCFQSSGADKNDFDKIDIRTINLAGRIPRKADQSRNWVSDSSQKNSLNAANDGAGSTAAAAENSGGNSAPLGLQEISIVVEEGASSTAPSGINNEEVTPPGQPSQGKSAGNHFESEGNSTPTFSHHGTASEGDPEARWRTHQALQNYKASTNSNLSYSLSGRLNRASVAGLWDYFLSKDELRELLLSKDEHYDLDALAMALLQGNIDVVVLLVYALGECDNPPYYIKRSFDFSSPASTENDIRQRIKLTKVTKAVIKHFRDEVPSFMAACEEEFRNHRDYGFLPLEQYLFHFSFTSRFEEVFSEMHKDRFRDELWRNVFEFNEQENATEDNNTNNELWRFLLKLHDGQGRTPTHVAVDEATEQCFLSTFFYFVPIGTNSDADRTIVTAPDGSGKLPAHRTAGVESLRPKFAARHWTMLVDALADVPAEHREVRTHPINNALAERGLSHISNGLVSVTNGFREEDEYVSTLIQLALIHDATEVLKQLVDVIDISSAECGYILKPSPTVPYTISLRMGLTEFACFVGANFETVEALLEKEESDLKNYQPTSSKPEHWRMEYKHWWPALHFVATYGNYKLLKYFIDSGFDPFIEDTEGNTVLHLVMRDGVQIARTSSPIEFQDHLLDYVSCRQLLLKDKRRKEKKILDATAIEDKKGCINLLLQAGCDIFKTNQKNQAPYPEGRLSTSPEFLSWWYDKQAKEFAAIQSSLNNAANAISVTATLVATASYVGPLQPPRGYTDSNQLEYQDGWVTAFVLFDTLSFYFAIIAIVLSLIPSLPVPQQAMVEELQRTRVMVTWAVGVVFMSIVCVLMSFAASSIAVVASSGVTAAFSLVSATVIVGGVLILLAFFFFLIRLLVICFPGNNQIRDLYRKTDTLTSMLLLLVRLLGLVTKTCYFLESLLGLVTKTCFISHGDLLEQGKR